MRGNNKQGFTLIEILVVLAIIGALMTIVVPNFKRLLPRREREVFIGKLNALTRYAWQHALIERKIHKIVFNLKKNQMWVEAATGTIKDGQPQTERVKGAYINPVVNVPSTIQIKNFIIEGFDEMTARGGSGATLTEFESWWYIMPDGLSQTVTLNFLDTKQKNAAGKPRHYALVLNPFNAQFKTYDGFQK